MAKKPPVKKAAPKVGRKTKPSASATKAETDTPSGKAISKTDAVREAWAKGISDDKAVVAWVAKEYGLEMPVTYPYQIRYNDKKKAGKKSSKLGRKPGATKTTQAVAGGEVSSGSIRAFEIASELIHVAGDAAEQVMAILRKAIR